MRYLLIIILFWGCVTPKKVDDYLKKHPEELAQLCTDKFPVVQDTFVNIWVDTFIVPEVHTEQLWDTLYVEGSPCPKPKVITKVVTITKKVTADLFLLQAQKTKDSLTFLQKEQDWMAMMKNQAELNRKSDSQIQRLKGANSWAIWLSILCAIVVLLRAMMRK